MDKVYLQMYSFGEFDPEGTVDQLLAASDMGYSGVELFGPNFALEAPLMKEALCKLGLEAISLHADLKDIPKMIPYALELGMHYIGIGMQYLPDNAAVIDFCTQLNELGAKCRAEGLMLTYHNHTQEFHTYGGKTILDIICENTDESCVGLELDAGWCAAAGADPVSFLNTHAGRVKLVHVKESGKIIGVQPPMNPADMKFDENGQPVMDENTKRKNDENMRMNCPTGEGVIDWKQVKLAADAQGCEGYIVEREYTYEGAADRMECLRADIAYCKEYM